MDEHVKKLVDSMDFSPPATEETLRSIELEIGMTFPAQHRGFMLESTEQKERL